MPTASGLEMLFFLMKLKSLSFDCARPWHAATYEVRPTVVEHVLGDAAGLPCLVVGDRVYSGAAAAVSTSCYLFDAG